MQSYTHTYTLAYSNHQWPAHILQKKRVLFLFSIVSGIGFIWQCNMGHMAWGWGWVDMSSFFDWLPIKETHIISLNLTAISSSTWVFALVSLVPTSGSKPSYIPWPLDDNVHLTTKKWTRKTIVFLANILTMKLSWLIDLRLALLPSYLKGSKESCQWHTRVVLEYLIN